MRNSETNTIVTLPSYKINDDIERLNSHGVHYIRLCSNESPLGPNYSVVNFLKKNMDKIHLYPDPDSRSLRKIIADRLSIDSNQIIIGNGSTEILDLITQCFISSGCSAVISAYSYLLYKILVENNRGQIITGQSNNLDYSLDNISKLVEKNTKIIYLANPNNPTGKWVELSKINKFLENIPSNVIVVIDEAYYEFLENQPGYYSAINLIKKYDNLIVTRTFSKAYGLAGLRIGYAISQSNNISKIKKFKQSANVNSLAQYAAEIAYKDDEYKNSVVRYAHKSINFIAKNLDELGVEYIPSNTNFMLIKTNIGSQMAYDALLKSNIIIQPMQLYNLPDYIRVSAGSENDIDSFIASFVKIHEKSNDPA